MSKPLADVLVMERTTQSFKDGWIKRIHLDVWMTSYFRFVGLARVSGIRIASKSGVTARAKHSPYWPNNWLGRLGNFLFGWIDT